MTTTSHHATGPGAGPFEGIGTEQRHGPRVCPGVTDVSGSALDRARMVEPFARWVVDDEPSTRFPIWTRGNAGEVFPNVVSPLTGSLFGAGPSRAQTAVFASMGFLSKRDLSQGDIAFTGIFGGHLYVNLSLGRLAGVRTPGMAPQLVDTQLFGTSDAPPYRPQPGDRELRAAPRIVRAAIRMLWAADTGFVEEARRAAHAWIRTVPDPATVGDAELLRLVATFPPRIERLFDPLLRASALSGLGRGAAERLLSRGGEDPTDLVNRLTAGLGTIDSALPARRLWALGRLVADDPDLTAMFDAGLPCVAAALDGDHNGSTSAGDRFQRAFTGFLSDHGHRGPDEYEMASPTWAQRPALALAIVERLRLAPPGRDPVAAQYRLRADRRFATAEARRRVPRPVRPALRRALRAPAAGATGRERSKDVFIRELATMKGVLHELMARARQRGAPADRRDCFLVTVDELPRFVAEPGALARQIADRAAQRDDLQARVPPFWFEGTIPDASTWPRRSRPAGAAAAGVLHGLGVCGGVATGPARVIVDPGDPRGIEPGDVLVAPITDPAWTPLFLAAVAIVVDVGAQQSHAAIVARELGIPAVVSVEGASRTIADGTWLRVDGGRGEVTVLDGPSNA